MFLLMFLVISLSCDFYPISNLRNQFILAMGFGSRNFVEEALLNAGHDALHGAPLFRSHSVFSRLICSSHRSLQNHLSLVSRNANENTTSGFLHR